MRIKSVCPPLERSSPASLPQLCYNNNHTKENQTTKSTNNMEAAVRNMTISVPSSDVKMAKNICRRMGWTVTIPRSHRKTGMELAIEDIKAGRIQYYSSLDELKAKFAHV